MGCLILQGKNQKRLVRDKMRFQLKKCSKCKKYTLKDICKECNEKTHGVHPAKFSPDDKYLRYRIAEKNK